MAQAPGAFLEQLKHVVLQRAADDDLVLPSLPRVASDALSQLRFGFDPMALARMIEPDPLITARLVRVANSAAYSAGPAAVTVSRAIERVGRSSLQSFLEKIAAEKVFTSQDNAINDACRRFWEHSQATGIIARRLAEAMPGGGAHLGDAAYMAGLLHDLGKPLLASMLLDAERRLKAAQATRTWLGVGEFVAFVTGAHRTIGLLVAATWDLPAQVRHALADPYTYDRDEPNPIANVVRLANALAKQAGVHIGGEDADQVEELIRNGAGILGLPSARLRQLSDGVAQQVSAKLL